MKIDLEDLQRHIEHIESGRYLSDHDRAALGERLIAAAPILLEALSVLAHEVASGEVVLLTRLDGTPASERLHEALRTAAEDDDPGGWCAFADQERAECGGSEGDE